MKYLYRILRLFFCPHKYETQGYQEVENRHTKCIVKKIYRQECKYCGRPNVYEI